MSEEPRPLGCLGLCSAPKPCSQRLLVVGTLGGGARVRWEYSPFPPPRTKPWPGFGTVSDRFLKRSGVATRLGTATERDYWRGKTLAGHSLTMEVSLLMRAQTQDNSKTQHRPPCKLYRWKLLRVDCLLDDLIAGSC